MPLRAGRISEGVRAHSVFFALLVLASLGAIGAGTILWPRQQDDWTRLTDTGDTLASVGGAMATSYGRLTARTAYLLAFHHAQDAEDVPRMLVTAERLERLGEQRLAAHVRHVARTVAASAALLPSGHDP